MLFDRYMDLRLSIDYHVFHSQRFFTKELWRKVYGFENEPKNLVENAFSWYWIKQDMMVDGHIFSKEMEKSIKRNYSSKYQPLFDEYESWKENENNDENSFWKKVRNYFRNIFGK